jgi:hypothetical protein
VGERRIEDRLGGDVIEVRLVLGESAAASLTAVAQIADQELNEWIGWALRFANSPAGARAIRAYIADTKRAAKRAAPTASA